MVAGDGLIGSRTASAPAPERRREGDGMRGWAAFMDGKMDAMEKRMDRDFDSVRADIAALNARFDDGLGRVHERVDDLSASIHLQMQDVKQSVSDTIAGHEREEIVRYESRFGAMTTAIGTLTEQVSDMAAHSVHRGEVVDSVAETISNAKKFLVWGLVGVVTTGATIMVWLVSFFVNHAEQIVRIMDKLGGL